MDNFVFIVFYMQQEVFSLLFIALTSQLNFIITIAKALDLIAC